MRTLAILPAGFEVDLHCPPTAGRYDGCWIALFGPSIRASRDHWIQSLIEPEDPSRAAATVVWMQRRTTRRGWPVTLRVVTIRTPTGDTIEKRLVAVYEFVHLLGGIMIRAPGDRVIEGTWVHEMIESAHPEWAGDDVVAITDLWR